MLQLESLEGRPKPMYELVMVVLAPVIRTVVVKVCCSYPTPSVSTYVF